MSVVFSEEEKCLIELLRNSLHEEAPKREVSKLQSVNLTKVITLAKNHAVLSLLYDITTEAVSFQELNDYIETESRQIVLQSYRLLFLTKYIVNKLTEQKIPVMVLKGVATGSMYPVPELRKSGDIDLLVPDNTDEKRLTSTMKNLGFDVSAQQHANHHMVFNSLEGIHIEVHTMLAEPFADKRINQAMEKRMKECWSHLRLQEVMGVELPVLDKPFHAYELLLHMLQHFMYAGFGLKLLCDWVAIWRQDWSAAEKNLFKELAQESSLERFTETITAICIRYLGLEQEKFAWEISDNNLAEETLREILDAEDFGNADVNRMVMMSGTGLGAYMKEFHHQMHLNFPKVGKCFILWPMLWIVTLVRFLRNNRKVRNTSTRKILQEASRRSKLIEKLKLLR